MVIKMSKFVVVILRSSCIGIAWLVVEPPLIEEAVVVVVVVIATAAASIVAAAAACRQALSRVQSSVGVINQITNFCHS